MLAVSAPIFVGAVCGLKANIFEEAHVLTAFKCQVFLRHRVRFNIKILPCPFSGTRSVFMSIMVLKFVSLRAENGSAFGGSTSQTDK